MPQARAGELKQMPLRLRCSHSLWEAPEAEPEMEATGLYPQNNRPLWKRWPHEASCRAWHQLKTRSRSNFITKTIRKMMKANPT